MKTIKTTVYEFDELSDKSKENAIRNLYDINVDYDWWESLYEDAERAGIKITAFDLYRKEIDGELLIDAIKVKEAILNNHGKSCATYKTVKDYDFRTKVDEDEFLYSLLGDYLTLLNHEYDYLTSEQAIAEAIRINEYDFTKDGKLY